MASNAFIQGDQVRYKPNVGTCGYEDSVEADGRVAGVVVGHSRTRVRVRLALQPEGRTVTRAVDAASLTWVGQGAR